MRINRSKIQHKRRGEDIQSTARRALRNLLDPLAGFVLDTGISAHDFEQLFRIAAVKNAANRQRELTGRLSISGIAASTGIPRAEISRILKTKTEDPDLDLQRHAANRILSVWHEEPKYVDKTGAPRDLPIFGISPSFDSLVRTYGRGIPTRAMLDELVRTGSVEILSSRKVCAKSLVAVSHGVGLGAVRAFGDTAAELMETMLSNIRDSSKFHFVSSIQGALTAPDVLPIFRKEISNRGQTFLAGLREMLFNDQMSDAAYRSARKPTRVSVTVFYSEKIKNPIKNNGTRSRRNLQRRKVGV